jgi:glutathione S-transferase
MSLRLHDYAASGNCYKVRLALHQLERECERVPVDIFAGETLGERFAALNPARTVPVLELDDGRPIPESNAILLYLAEGTELLPESLDARAQVWRWLFFEQSELMPAVGGLRFRRITERLQGPADEERRRVWALSALGVLERGLDGSHFLAGAYSVADISAFAYTHVAHEGGIELAPFPAVRRWLARVEARPPFIDDLEPYPPNAWPGRSRSIYD